VLLFITKRLSTFIALNNSYTVGDKCRNAAGKPVIYVIETSTSHSINHKRDGFEVRTFPHPSHLSTHVIQQALRHSGVSR